MQVLTAIMISIVHKELALSNPSPDPDPGPDPNPNPTLTRYECSAGGAWGNLSTPAKHGELRSADEFVLAFDYNRDENEYARGVPAALVAAGVIEEARTAGRTQFGEPRLVYRAKF